MKSKKSGGAAQSMMDKKKALFGLPQSATPEADLKSKKSGQSQKGLNNDNDYYAHDAAGDDLEDVMPAHHNNTRGA